MILDGADVLVLASRVLRLPTEQVVEDCDLAALGRACDVQRRHPGEGFCAARLAALLRALLIERPFSTGNDAVAVAAVGLAASLDDRVLDLEGVSGLIDQIRSGALDDQSVAEWLDHRVQRNDKEAHMFERFTPRARAALVHAQQEAVGLGHRYIGTEHIVLGVALVTDGIGAKALAQLGISAEALRNDLKELSGTDVSPAGVPPFKPAAKKLLEQALATALRMGHNYIGTEHVLLAAFKVPEGLGADLLARQGATEEQAAAAVVTLLTAGGASPASSGPSRSTILQPINNLLDDNERLRAEIERLRVLLRRHGIDPDAGTASA
jgi:hypothetical protein